MRTRKLLLVGLLALCLTSSPLQLFAQQTRQEKIEPVCSIPGLVAFWDFVQREPAGERRFLALGPTGATPAYPLDVTNYVFDYWGEGRQAGYSDFSEMNRGPFGNAVQIKPETDATFRPCFIIPRSRLHDTALDIKGDDQSVTVVVWAIRESGNHALAGIWHEGTDLKQDETQGIERVERGQRQYALFAGLSKPGTACGHASENGAGSFLNKYALHKCNSLAAAPAIPSDAPAETLNQSWQCFAMTLNHETDQLTGWLNGEAGERWLENPKSNGLFASAYQAYQQGYWHQLPGLQEGEDPKFPAHQYYHPPEDQLIKTVIEEETLEQKTALQFYPYTRVRVTYGKNVAGDWETRQRELVALSINPWWYPHGIYRPKDDGTGGPFTIGRVIHSARSVGFTGWIGGVAVFDRALSEDELKILSGLRQTVVDAP